MTGSVESFETIINAADTATRCTRVVGKIGGPGEGSKTPPGPCEDRCPTGVLMALTIPELRAWKGCYDARGEKNLFIPCCSAELERKAGESSCERTGWYKRAVSEQTVGLLLPRWIVDSQQ